MPAKRKIQWCQLTCWFLIGETASAARWLTEREKYFFIHLVPVAPLMCQGSSLASFPLQNAGTTWAELLEPVWRENYKGSFSSSPGFRVLDGIGASRAKCGGHSRQPCNDERVKTADRSRGKKPFLQRSQDRSGPRQSPPELEGFASLLERDDCKPLAGKGNSPILPFLLHNFSFCGMKTVATCPVPTNLDISARCSSNRSLLT